MQIGEDKGQVRRSDLVWQCNAQLEGEPSQCEHARQMDKGAHVQGDFRIMHIMKVLSTTNITGEKFAERDIRRIHVDGKHPDILGELGKRLEIILEHMYIIWLELETEAYQGRQG